MIHYILFSYISFPFLFSLGIYLQERKKIAEERIENDSYWKWLKFILGDFYKGQSLIIFLLAPIMFPIEIFLIIRDLIKWKT